MSTTTRGRIQDALNVLRDLLNEAVRQSPTVASRRKLMLSYSPTWMMEPVDREGLLDEVEAFIVEHLGRQITRPLVLR
jgi:hypothetical protein